MVKFLHVADLHLGYRQYNSFDRFVDFNRAFKAALDLARDEAVDFVVICGDMFNDARASAEVMVAVHDIISSFKRECAMKFKRDVPVIAIEGNHDMSGYQSQRSWMQFLAGIGLIVLLSGYRAGDRYVFKPWTPGETRPGYIDVGDARVYGVPFQGATTSDLFPKIAASIDPAPGRFTILAMHFGIAQEVKNKQGVDFGEPGLAALREKVQYLALGHFHKQYTLPMQRPWIFNPGSLETVDITDQQYPRGFFIVETRGTDLFPPVIYTASNGPAGRDGPSYTTRAFVAGFIPLVGEARLSFEATKQLVVEQVKHRYPALKPRDQGRDEDLSDAAVPVVNVRITGTIEYPGTELDLKRIEEELKDTYLILDAKVYNHDVRSSLDDFQVPEEERGSLSDIERAVFTRMVEGRDPYKACVGETVDMMMDLKRDLTGGMVAPATVKDKIASYWYTFIKPDEQKRESIAARQEMARAQAEKAANAGTPPAKPKEAPAAAGEPRAGSPSLLDYFGDEDGLDDADDLDEGA